ncbi:hypothetical protein WL77_31400 [Burkholderia ubonensis]|uniref:hypothetical protein n=1 Tax=Burkholderia ubonensis TaxID=101571 RepID=UPI0007563541|nr:hypothetical protein [Burkholderia ubonensis]KWE57281.1 hypothetical protein WL77_31400 [Burkholderia ubonensis]KWE68730.1 hypothetical protein WL79_21860 [Burkholderia ubonensis]
MENESDQMTIDDALEADTVSALRRLFEKDILSDSSPPVERAESATLIGEVTDTHHPDAMGLIRVKWSMQDGNTCEHWLECVDGVKPGIGDRVVLQSAANWPEHLITGLLKRKGRGEPVEPIVEPAVVLALEPDKCVQVSDASGCPLLQVRASPDGPVVTLLNRNVNIEVAGKLRLSAQTLELEGGRGGVDIRTEADTVVRSRYVRLN